MIGTRFRIFKKKDKLVRTMKTYRGGVFMALLIRNIGDR